MQTRLRWIAGLLMALMPSAASADLVTLRGGRVLNVTSVVYEADTAVITLRSGGEMRMPRSFVQSVGLDEVPYVPPVDPSAVVTIVPVAVETEVRTSNDLVALVDQLAARHGVSSKLAHALVKVESNYDPRAVSPKGAMGLMQLMPAMARHYEVVDPFDPAQNLGAGLQHLRGLLDRFGKGRESLALAAYNAGEGAVSRYGGIPPYRETQDYVRRILSLTGR